MYLGIIAFGIVDFPFIVGKYLPAATIPWSTEYVNE